MQLQHISNILGLQGANVIEITHETIEAGKIAIVWIEPILTNQICPYCKSPEVTRNGVPGCRRIRHLNIANTQCYLSAQRQRLKCGACEGTHTYQYPFVTGKERYTHAYKEQIYKIAIGSTVSHGATVTETPYRTAERFFKEAAQRIAPLTKAAALELAQRSTKLILGIDDFAIRKGHNYNTGIHDLRGETFLDITEGRTLSELRSYMEKNPQIAALQPFAIVMDLAQAYHTFAAEFFPNAIRVADRFHVNRYIMDALKEVRRRVAKNLAPQARLNLNRHRHVLNKRNDTLTDEQQTKLDELLKYSNDLKAVYELKEMLIDWYDLSLNHKTALVGFLRWLAKGRSFNIPEIDKALITFVNWQTEIVNYHQCRFTNGIVEGRNGKIKSLQRRRFFLRNRSFYEALIIIECNSDIALDEFKHLSG